MSIPILKQIFRPNATHNPRFFSIAFSSSSHSTPVLQIPPPPDPLVSDAVSILTHHRSKSRWSTLHSLSPLGFTPSQFSQISLSIKNNPHLVLRFFSFTSNRSLCTHDLISYSTLIHILARARLKSQVKEIIRLAIRLPEGTKSECLLKLFESLVKTYKRCGSAPFVFDLLIKSALESKKIEGSVEIVRLLRSRGISPQISTCNALIWEVCKNRGADSGYAVYREIFGLDDMNEGDVKWVVRVKPNVNTFNALMECFYRDGEMEKVEEIWREMKEMDCEANSFSYSVLMEVLCKRGEMREAEKLWEEMNSNGLDHDVVAFNTMIGGFCENGEIERAEELFKEMGLNRINYTSVTCDHLVNGYCKVHDVDSAMLLYKDVIRKGFRLEGLTVDSLIEELCRDCRVLEGLEVMNVAIASFGFCPRGERYEALIKGLCEVGEMDEALKLQARMVGKGFEPNLVVYNAFIGGYMKQGNEEMAASLRKEMLEAL